ncbi:clamp-loader subunit [Escherichia phage vB_EcoM_SYGD1]|nr:clamp-loader subunit [Escherichia phage vB_EcoM_SYGD1]
MSLFEDDIQLNEHQVAWYSKDWTAVQSAADSFKEKAENEFFEIIGAINNKTKCSIAQKDYSKYMVENALSQFPECMPAVYAMNLIGSGLSDEAEVLIIKLLAKRYQVNTNDAINYKSILTKNGKLPLVLKELKGLVTDDFLKEVTKNVKEQKQLKKLALEW